MFHPLFRLLTQRPDLLLDHAGAYAELATLQLGEAAASLRRRAAWAVLAAGLLLVGLALGGGALLLLAVIPVSQMPAPWLLAAAPGVPLLVAVGVVLRLQRQPWSWSMQTLSEQWAADTRLLAEASAE